jgi:hypothetical protein
MTTLRSLGVIGILVFALASSSSAATYTLDELVNGSVSSFQSDNGLLTFSNFEITKLKKLSGDLSLYTVTTVDDGFVLSSSAFTANSGGLKRLRFTYTVSAKQGALITGAELAMEGTRETGRIMVDKEIDSPTNNEGTFLLNLLKKDTSILSDSDEFVPGESLFEVEEQIRIKKISSLTSVRNSYTLNVPEPPTLSLLLAGVVGLAMYGRQRVR